MAFSDIRISTRVWFSFIVVFLLGTTAACVGYNELDEIAGHLLRSGPGDGESARSLLAGIQSAKIAVLAMCLPLLLACVAFALWLIASTVKPLEEASYIAETVTSGDLSQDFETDRGGEFGRLLQGMCAMEDKLTEVVSEIRSASDSIMEASDQVAVGFQELSGRTEEQASSLQQTAATMEEFTSRIKRNTDSALNAHQLALSASSLASRGGGHVSELSGAMQEIHQSSTRIVGIIDVIDSMAFQTNILALNAAVEAARAGEHGRGFAVVAAEVRTLAQRSAVAAREIKQLIEDSAGKVEKGARLASDAGQTISEMVDSTRRVQSILDDISAASAEQTVEVEELSRTISQLDQVTQKNAALVETAVGAGATLQRQASTLAEVVGRFKLD